VHFLKSILEKETLFFQNFTLLTVPFCPYKVESIEQKAGIRTTTKREGMFRIFTLFVLTEVPGFYEKLSGNFFLTYELYLKQQKTQHFNTPKLWSQMLPERLLKI
jgi:hypothetical protein